MLHLDAYFQERIDGLLAEGLVERFDAATVVLVEWAPQMAAWLPRERLDVVLRAAAAAPGAAAGTPAEDPEAGDGRRELVFTAHGVRAAGLLEALGEAWKSGQEA